jgi:uncharacterized membrane protein
MKLKSYKLVFVGVSLIGMLLLASPALSLVLPPLPTQPFSEIYILGPDQKFADYPYNLTIGQAYPLYLGVGNHENSSAYYFAVVKIRNQTEALPNTNTSSPSPLLPLYEYQFAVAKSQSVEVPLSFSIVNGSINNQTSSISQIAINDKIIEVNEQATWNNETHGFPYELFVELYIYNSHLGSVQFYNRYVTLQLNLK